MKTIKALLVVGFILILLTATLPAVIADHNPNHNNTRGGGGTGNLHDRCHHHIEDGHTGHPWVERCIENGWFSYDANTDTWTHTH